MYKLSTAKGIDKIMEGQDNNSLKPEDNYVIV